mmetsp:Transcript_8951/g.20478  ORF Transcript_8951/g.20478 Transcript_8951/m.20478 type:complete len:315 (+) Transcript_8951:2276-3220(+)
MTFVHLDPIAPLVQVHHFGAQQARTSNGPRHHILVDIYAIAWIARQGVCVQRERPLSSHVQRDSFVRIHAIRHENMFASLALNQNVPVLLIRCLNRAPQAPFNLMSERAAMKIVSSVEISRLQLITEVTTVQASIHRNNYFVRRDITVLLALKMRSHVPMDNTWSEQAVRRSKTARFALVEHIAGMGLSLQFLAMRGRSVLMVHLCRLLVLVDTIAQQDRIGRCHVHPELSALNHLSRHRSVLQAPFARGGLKQHICVLLEHMQSPMPRSTELQSKSLAVHALGDTLGLILRGLPANYVGRDTCVMEVPFAVIQ